DGSEKLPAFIIGKAKKPCAFGNKMGTQLGFYYCNNAKAWMTTALYQEWLQEWDCKLERQNWKVLLLQNNFSGHIIPENLQNIHVKNYTPNLTAHIQPMDQGIIQCFKAHYRRQYIECVINRYDRGITPLEIYDINQLQAMCLADAAWREVDTTTIRHCWQKADILPPTQTPPVQPMIAISMLINSNTVCDLPVSSDENPIKIVEKRVESALYELVSTGVLQASNRMDIKSLLNSVAKSWVIDETTDEEIYQAVINARQAQENGIINGGDDDANDDGPIEDCPTCCDALQAASVINRYIEHLDDPVAWKLEALLSSLGWQMCLDMSRSQVSTSITDYFSFQ
ncbi:DDE-domain-containing protein, partial [Tricholoma matsutake]